MALDLESICTDRDLLNRAGEKRVNQAKPKEAERDQLRAQALRDVLSALALRTPPIFEGDLSDPTQLHDAVKYRALQMIFENAMTTGDDLHARLAKQYAGEYAAAVSGNYRVGGGVVGPSGGTFSLERR